MTTTQRPVVELVEEAVARLSSAELFAAAGRAAAQEARGQAPAAWRADIDGAVKRTLAALQTIGVDPDLAAAAALRGLLRGGVAHAAARSVMQRVAGWRPQSGQQRVEAVAGALLGLGLDEGTVRRALAYAVGESA